MTAILEEEDTYAGTCEVRSWHDTSPSGRVIRGKTGNATVEHSHELL